MKKHKFSNGDGMSLESSTPQERRIIRDLLVDRGYQISYYFKKDEDSQINFDCDWFITNGKITSPLTYTEMLNILNHEATEHTCYIQTNDLPDVVKNDFVFLNAIAEDSGRYLYECLEDARKDLKTLFIVLAGMIDTNEWERLSWKKDEIDCGNYSIYLIDEKFN